MRINNKIVTSLILAICFVLSACGNTETETATNESHKQLLAMDTVMTLTAYGNKADDAIDSAVNIINDLDAQLDPESQDSVVYKINNASGNEVEVSDDVLSMLTSAEEIYSKTNGALDLSTYPLSKLWGFINLDETGEGYVPTQEEINEELAKLCFGEIEIKGSKVTLPEYGQLSFGAIAKGYTSDKVIEAMKEAGATSGIISLGGNVQTLGTKEDGTEWNVAVEDPNDTSQYLCVIKIDGEKAVITSGSYQRYFEEEGKIYHHIIDPSTGAPSESGLISVTIVTDRGVMGDALSTAMFVLGPEKAAEYWREYGDFEMIMVTTDNRVLITSGISNIITLQNDGYTLEIIE